MEEKQVKAGRLASLLIILAAAGCAAHSRPSQASVAPGQPPSGARDALGNVVRLSAPPHRIVSWAPNATEILFALGLAHRVVGVTRYCDFPPEAKRKPKVGSIIAPSIERTLALRPDLVVAARLNDRRIIEAARRAKLQVFAIDPTSIEEVYGAILSLGRLTDTTQRAKWLVADMQRTIGAVHRRSVTLQRKRRPTVFFVYQLNPIWTAGRGTFPDEIVKLAGGENAAGGVRGFAALSSEAIIQVDPDVLLIATMDGGDTSRILSHPALSKLAAVRKGRVYQVNPDILGRAGPRLAEAVDIVANILAECCAPHSTPQSGRAK